MLVEGAVGETGGIRRPRRGPDLARYLRHLRGGGPVQSRHVDPVEGRDAADERDTGAVRRPHGGTLASIPSVS